MGVAATFLNSTLSAAEASARGAALLRGDYRLLYVAPERLLLPDFRDGLLARLIEAPGVSAITIDEAHCVSEWGRSEEHTSELQSLMRISYAVFCLKKKQQDQTTRREL